MSAVGQTQPLNATRQTSAYCGEPEVAADFWMLNGALPGSFGAILPRSPRGRDFQSGRRHVLYTGFSPLMVTRLPARVWGQ